MTKSQKREFKRLSTSIKDTMASICYMNASKMLFDNRESSVDTDVDVAFAAISNCFPMFSCIEDTVTRRCAKTEIYDLIEECRGLYSKSTKFNMSQYIEFGITAEMVLEDIIDMNTDDE